MGPHQDLAKRIRCFCSALQKLCVDLHGDALKEAVHRRYEAVMCATPKPLLDEAHDAMHQAMYRHGLVRNRPANWPLGPRATEG